MRGLRIGVITATVGSLLAGVDAARSEPFFPFPGDVLAEVRSINAAGDAVGYSKSRTGIFNAVLWSGGTVRKLSHITDPWFGSVANDINDLGQIIGTGSFCGIGDPPCSAVLPSGIVVPALGFGPVAWLEGPDSPVGIGTPRLPPCEGLDDEFATIISNSGYIGGSSLRSPHVTTEPLCSVGVLGLYENGPASVFTTEGFVHDVFVDFLYDAGGNGKPAERFSHDGCCST
jgi:hypothetical protein